MTRVAPVACGVFLALLLPAATLEERIDSIIDASPLAKRSAIGVHVVNLESHKTLYAKNSEKLFLPASNMKLFTTALALERLAPDHTFLTRLITESSGNLVLVGGGDPSMSGREYPYKKDAPAHPALSGLEHLVADAVAGGLTRVDGDIVGDDTLYPWVPYPPNWSQSDALGLDGAPVSALTLNDNAITLRILPGEKPGDPAEVAPVPSIEYFAIDNRVVTGEPRSATQIHIERYPGSRQVELSGSIPAGKNIFTEAVAIDDPAYFAACALYEILVRHGVEIRGVPVARHRSPGEPAPGVSGRLWATRTSPPLSELLQVVAKVSQNLHAELMLREVGRVKGSDGTREAGMKVMDGYLKAMGATSDEARVDDGSGLSRNAEVAPRLVTRLLSHMNESDMRDVWMAFLPVGGEDGTLSRRLCCSSESRAIQAKTGTLNRAVALSGYADSKSNGKLAFSILVNNFGSQTRDVQAWVDKIALALIE
jgi:serine-type D-Ala-D-Ala carboxypeptidase/endopeptidase (penicillin-binding protein 4)